MADPLVRSLQEALADRYTLLTQPDGSPRLAGEGGTAVVYLAADVRHGRQVAIKLLKPEIARTIGHERFLREIEFAARLTHPHILGLIDSGVVPYVPGINLPFYVMPYVEGESLRARLARERQLPVGEALRLAREVADALDFAHRQGVVHRDIKPANILLLGGHAVVADFGIARAMAGAAIRSDHPDELALTLSGLALGTPAYMSPEQAYTSTDIDGRSDIYSLGCVLYHMLAGVPPFVATDPLALAAQHLKDDPASLSEHRVALDPDVSAMVQTAMAKRPADRFPTAAAFSDALGSLLTGARPITTSIRTRRLRRRIGGGVGILGLVGIVALLWTRPSGQGPASAPAMDPEVVRRVAVLYFGVPRSADPRLPLFAEAITEDMIDRLSRVPQLHVVSAAGVRPYRDLSLPPDSLRRALAAGILVGGETELRDGEIRLQVRITNALTGDQIHNFTVQRPLSDPQKLSEDMAEEVTDFLRKQLGLELARQRDTATSDVRAWETNQRGQRERRAADSLIHVGDSLGARRALESADSLFRVASQRDRDWPAPFLARIRVAMTRGELDTAGAFRRWQDSTRRLIDRAARAFGETPEVRELRGTLLSRDYIRDGVGDPERAITELRAGIGFDNPSRAHALNTLNNLLFALGRSAESYDAAREAYRADAFLSATDTILIRLFLTSVDQGRVPEARDWCHELSRRFPGSWGDGYCRIHLLILDPPPRNALARADTALAMLSAATPTGDTLHYQPGWGMMRAAVAAHAGLATTAHDLIRSTPGTALSDGDRAFWEAVTQQELGQRDSAVTLLEICVKASPQLAASVTRSALFERLHALPRFQRLQNLATGGRLTGTGGGPP